VFGKHLTSDPQARPVKQTTSFRGNRQIHIFKVWLFSCDSFSILVFLSPRTRGQSSICRALMGI